MLAILPYNGIYWVISMEKKLSTVAQNIRKRMYDLDIRSYKALEDKAGITRDSIRNLMSGRTTSLRANKLGPIADALGVTVDELTSQNLVNLSLNRDEVVIVPKYDLRHTVDIGGFPERKLAADHVTFSRSWLTGLIRGDLDSLAVIEAEGDSMEPTIRSGDQVIINIADKSIVDSGIFALFLNEMIVIKRIFILPNEFEIRSENAESPTWRVKKEDLTDINIVGRAVARVGKLR